MAEIDPGPLDNALQQLGRPPSFEGFCGLAPLFQAFVESRAVVPWLAAALEELAHEPTASAGVLGNPTQLWVRRHGRLSVFVARSKHDGHPPTITGHACHRLRTVIAGTLLATRYRHTQNLDSSIFDATARLERIDEQWLGPGSFLQVEAWRDVVEFTGGEGVVIGLDSGAALTTRWAYDRSSLLPIASVIADPAAARLEHAIQMLAEIGAAEDAPALEALTIIPFHGLRWSAIRGAVRLAHPDGETLVRRALEDPHPSVRRAAAAALPLFARARANAS